MQKKPIKNFENYSITPDGRIFRKDKELIRKDDWQGYPRVALFKDGKRHNRKLHRLVAETFLDNPNNFPEIRHLDNDRFNYQVSNLAWGDRISNAKDRQERGSYKYKTKVIEGKSFLDQGDHFSLPEVNKRFEIGTGSGYGYDPKKDIFYINSDKKTKIKFKSFEDQWNFIKKSSFTKGLLSFFKDI